MLSFEDLAHTPKRAIRHELYTIGTIGKKIVRCRNCDSLPIMAANELPMTHTEFLKEFRVCKSLFLLHSERLDKAKERQKEGLKMPFQAKLRANRLASNYLFEAQNLREFIMRSPIFKLKTY